MISFNKPFFTGNEILYIQQAIKSGHIAGNGIFTQNCQKYFEQKYHFGKSVLTTSCTDALEMASILCNIQTGDEVIIPSYTFVSSALPFVRQGAKLVFADSQADHPNMDAEKIEQLITPRTKAIVAMHYAGVSCDMDKIMGLAAKYKLFVIEDAAHSVDSYYVASNGPKALGSMGHFSAFSFHETKNIVAGEGGMLNINDPTFFKRAEIIWEKGTNRAEFISGKIDKYGWVDIGSSFLPSEITAAFLFAQLESLDKIQAKRKSIWQNYYELLKPLSEKGFFTVPVIPPYATNNGHIFYIVCNSAEDRTRLIASLKDKGISTAFHYQSLHKSKYYIDKHDGRELKSSDHFTECLLRLPFFFDLTMKGIELVCNEVRYFYE